MNHAEYVEKAKAFITTHSKTALVARKSGTRQGEKYEANLKAWGAWRAYFLRIGYPLRVFDKSDYWTVPSLWPHEFDPQATVTGDYVAGEEYTEHVRREQAKAYEERKVAPDVVRRWRENEAKANPKAPPPPPPRSPGDLKTPAKPASDELRATMGLPPREKPKPDDQWTEGFDIP